MRNRRLRMHAINLKPVEKYDLLGRFQETTEFLFIDYIHCFFQGFPIRRLADLC